ncbi:HAD-superfamily hydrolase [Syncephalis pseudoplumigaleata]|uniref:HAD-superfamily hydrolase n=1 Tax=Syncephalis pseudoplumigaleata TaxID=1712513 RepID=A0A4V1J2B6_9FUNG|nr:HAD-superfamily hydrolase [Syncephalis pseudoplumigaleata]|eukprot:RKP27989.1 HAD-superfamily hydrolase [Syncephalis pseudoplumigaleata]
MNTIMWSSSLRSASPRHRLYRALSSANKWAAGTPPHRRPLSVASAISVGSEHVTLPPSNVLSNDVFANNELDLNKVRVYGFDYDYTLARYTSELPKTIYTLLRDALVDHLRYPAVLRGLQYDPAFAIRGLHYGACHTATGQQNGHTGYLMKLDSYGNIQRNAVYYGRRPVVDPLTTLGVEVGAHIPRHLVKGRMRQLVDLFSMPNTCLMADIIEYFEGHGIGFHPQHLADDMQLVSEMLHSGTGIGLGPLHKTILGDIEKYLDPSRSLVQYLEKLHKYDRKLFLLTNSGYEFVDRGLAYITGCKDWRDLFDVCIVNAMKPAFYRGRRPFRYANLGQNGSASEVLASGATQRNGQDASFYGSSWSVVNEFKRGDVYSGGNIVDFCLWTGWNGGGTIYIGDSIYNDLVDPALQQGWRTGIIINELEGEIEIQRSAQYRHYVARFTQLEGLLKSTQRSILHELGEAVELDDAASSSSINAAGEAAINDGGRDRSISNHQKLHHHRQQLRQWRAERRAIAQQLKDLFNPQFGSVFRTMINPSMFADKIRAYSDLYTSSLENLNNYPLNHVFYPERVQMPHEQRLGSVLPAEDLLDEQQPSQQLQ